MTRVPRWREEIMQFTEESLEADPTEKASLLFKIMERWSAIVTFYLTNDPIDERQLALAKEGLYNAHIALLGVLEADDRRRMASVEFVRGMRAEREAEKRARPSNKSSLHKSRRTRAKSRRIKLENKLDTIYEE
eukprot:CAMPEP_0118895096 /NCGR_PEP_ID=MMETSP1166-20130328/3602_1 /TAXON_ID=1104430 /ORGANISM="Chrysoreinhardia sp, Strain CCMP3193" /LENGTH=133 /DNA_ID=CAMNT_0006834087 /DNA_START=27 /DNA_END=428 /DNA_ORIENTATION=+